ncbi:MAG: hypothetical protein AB7E85_07635 [Pseudobdellovibrionaceae bacterium]
MARPILSLENDNRPMPSWFPVALLGGMLGTTILGAWALASGEPAAAVAQPQNTTEQVQLAQAPQAPANQ